MKKHFGNFVLYGELKFKAEIKMCELLLIWSQVLSKSRNISVSYLRYGRDRSKQTFTNANGGGKMEASFC